MAKDSRLVEIFRQELKKDKGMMSAFLSAASESGKEKTDIKNILPKSGISGAIAEKMFGKSYRYGSNSSKKDDSKVERVGGDIASSKYLPSMAKDMNLMRLNMQKLVTLAGGKPSKTPSTSLLKGKSPSIIDKKEKESGTSGGGGMIGMLGGIGSAVSGIAGSLLSGLGSLAGGILSIGGSIVGSIASMIGGIAGGLFSIIGGALSAMGPLGMILAAGAGFVIYGLSKSIDFEGLKTSFGGLYNDITTGIKNYLGISDSSQETLTRQVSNKLDNYFGGNTFNNTINFIEDTFTKLSDTVEDSFHGIVKVVTTIFDSLSHDFIALTKNLYADFRTGLIMIAGAMAGEKVGSALGTLIGFAAGGPAGAAAGHVIGGLAGGLVGGAGAGLYATITKSQDPTVATVDELSESLTQLKRRKAQADKGFAAGNTNFDPKTFQSPDSNFGTLNMPLTDKIALIEKELSKRQVGNTNSSLNNVGKLYTEGATSPDRNAIRRTRDQDISNNRANRSTPNSQTTGSSSPERVAEGGGAVAPYGGYKNRQEFTDAMMPYAEKAAKILKVPAEAIIAQWGLETAFGKAGAVQGQFNYGNIQGGYSGDYEMGKDAGNTRKFDKFPTMDAFVNNFTKNLMNPNGYYKITGNEDLTTEQFANRLMPTTGPKYAEDPNYATKLTQLTKEQKNIKPGIPGSTPTYTPTTNPNTANLASNKNKQDDLFGQVLDILREMLSGDTKQSTPIPVATATPNTTRSVSSAYNNTDLFKKNYMEVIGKQYADYQA